MALTSTIYTFDITLSNVDRGVYEALSLRVAMHPSESPEYFTARLFAYCLEYTEGIVFSKGVSDPDDPTIAVRDLTGALRAWIEIGAPDAARLHKAAKASPRVAVYTHRDPAQLQRHWLQLWEQVFEPARVRLAPAGVAPGTSQEGLLLRVAAGPDLPVLELELPERGGRLFNPADARRAAEISELVDRGLASARAFEQGAREERRRIASDLHDDLGARLLTIAQISQQSGQAERVADLARQALDDMRLAVRGLMGEAVAAQDALADWRAETVTRLTVAGLVADWRATDPPAGLMLPARTMVQITRILREAVSNVIRHASARQCGVRLTFDASELLLEVEDDGRGLPTATYRAGGGHGLASIERRARALGGSHAFRGLAPGTRLEVRVPLSPG